MESAGVSAPLMAVSPVGSFQSAASRLPSPPREVAPTPQPGRKSVKSILRRASTAPEEYEFGGSSPMPKPPKMVRFSDSTRFTRSSPSLGRLFRRRSMKQRGAALRPRSEDDHLRRRWSRGPGSTDSLDSEDGSDLRMTLRGRLPKSFSDDLRETMHRGVLSKDLLLQTHSSPDLSHSIEDLDEGETLCSDGVCKLDKRIVRHLLGCVCVRDSPVKLADLESHLPRDSLMVYQEVNWEIKQPFSDIQYDVTVGFT